MDRLRHHCKAQQWEIIGEYIEEGASGRDTKRPQYLKMLKEMDLWDAILVIKMDRIHRNRANFIDMMEYLNNNYKNFISMTESLDTSTAMGRFVMGIIMDIAQLESEQLGERVFIAMQQKAKDPNEGRNGGKPPMGYRWVTETFNDGHGKLKTKSHLEPIAEDLNIVKKGFELYSNGISIEKVAEKLNLTYDCVRYFLSNPIYIGYHRWHNVLKKADLKPIISEMLFNKVQRRRCKVKTKEGEADYNIKNCKGIEMQPLLIKGKSVMEFDSNRIKSISAISKSKHSYQK